MSTLTAPGTIIDLPPLQSALTFTVGTSKFVMPGFGILLPADSFAAQVRGASVPNETLVRLAGSLGDAWQAGWLNEPDAFPER